MRMKVWPVKVPLATKPEQTLDCAPMMLRHLTTFALAASALTSPAPAQIIDATSEEAFVEFLQDNGYRAKLDYLENGRPVIDSADSGSNFSIYFLGCSGEKQECRTIQFHTGYDLPNGMSMERVNDWNRTARFAKVYIDDQGDPDLEWDVNLEFGVTTENLFYTLVAWTDVMQQFEDFIGW